MSRIPEGAWAAPLRARVRHYFCDGGSHCLCGQYRTEYVKPSQFGGALTMRKCPTCDRRRGYLWAGGRP
jgi:hypothetical protein